MTAPTLPHTHHCPRLPGTDRHPPRADVPGPRRVEGGRQHRRRGRAAVGPQPRRDPARPRGAHHHHRVRRHRPDDARRAHRQRLAHRRRHRRRRREGDRPHQRRAAFDVGEPDRERRPTRAAGPRARRSSAASATSTTPSRCQPGWRCGPGSTTTASASPARPATSTSAPTTAASPCEAAATGTVTMRSRQRPRDRHRPARRRGRRPLRQRRRVARLRRRPRGRSRRRARTATSPSPCPTTAPPTTSTTSSSERVDRGTHPHRPGLVASDHGEERQRRRAGHLRLATDRRGPATGWGCPHPHDAGSHHGRRPVPSVRSTRERTRRIPREEQP